MIGVFMCNGIVVGIFDLIDHQIVIREVVFASLSSLTNLKLDLALA